MKENNKINIKFLNNIHKILLDNVKGNKKEPGKIRNIQNWIGPKVYYRRGYFFPPISEDVLFY